MTKSPNTRKTPRTFEIYKYRILITSTERKCTGFSNLLDL